MRYDFILSNILFKGKTRLISHRLIFKEKVKEDMLITLYQNARYVSVSHDVIISDTCMLTFRNYLEDIDLVPGY